MFISKVYFCNNIFSQKYSYWELWLTREWEIHPINHSWNCYPQFIAFYMSCRQITPDTRFCFFSSVSLQNVFFTADIIKFKALFTSQFSKYKCLKKHLLNYSIYSILPLNIFSSLSRERYPHTFDHYPVKLIILIVNFW